MKNEFVNIDQVFQERMALHEEPMSRGAWNKMHQRLEETMPQKKRPLFFIKRFFAVILLLSLSLVGARKALDFSSSKGSIARSEAAALSTHAVVANNKQQLHSEVAVAIPTSNPQSNGVADITNNAPAENKAIDNSEPSETSSLITTTTTRTTHQHSITINNNKNETKTAVHEKTATPKITEVPVEELDAPQSIESSTANTQDVTKNNSAFAKKTIQASSSFISSNKLINKNMPIYSHTDYNKANFDSLSYVIKKDTIKKIFIKQRYAINAFSGKRELITDSFIEKATIDRKVYASQINNLALGKPTYKEAELSIVELSSKRIATKASSWNPANFMNWMTQAKINLSNTQPNYAFLFGINGANNGSNTFAGFHLGVSGQISLGTNWLASAEFKYVMKMNSGFAFQFLSKQTSCNDSVLFQSGGTNFMSYNILQDSMAKTYNFNSIHSITIPFSIQYNYKRWSIMGGLSLAYNFKLKTSEINYKSPPQSHRDTLLPGSFVSSSVNTIIPINDFASKLNINYLIGLQYHISPMIYLDARMIKSISTSASSSGEKQVYDQVYKMPTFELSLGYFFRKKN